MKIDQNVGPEVEVSMLNDAITGYVRNLNAVGSIGAVPKSINFGDFFEHSMLVIQTIRAGIPYSLFDKIRRITPFSEDEWAAYLNISKKTLLRHKAEKGFVFKPIHTEKIIELAEVTNFGNNIFDTRQQFHLWLNTPSFAIGNLKPAELLKDSYGKELVMAELNRIEHGIFA